MESEEAKAIEITRMQYSLQALQDKVDETEELVDANKTIGDANYEKTLTAEVEHLKVVS